MESVDKVYGASRGGGSVGQTSMSAKPSWFPFTIRYFFVAALRRNPLNMHLRSLRKMPLEGEPTDPHSLVSVPFIS